MNTENDPSQAAKWLEENAIALGEHRSWVETHGTFGDRVRAWKRARKVNDTQPRFEDANDN